MKILHLTQFLGVGGLEKVLLMLIQEQMKDGHKVELLVYDYEQTWVTYFKSHGIKVRTNFRKRKGYDLKLLRLLNRLASQFDVIHTHDLNPLMYAAPVKFLGKFKGKTSPRLIHTAHGMDHLNQRSITKFYEMICSKFTDVIVGVSQGVCNEYKKLGISPEKLITINNGTKIYNLDEKKSDLRYVIRKELGLSSDCIVWACLARVVPLKDQKLICDLARSLPQHHFLLIGPSGDDQYWNEVQSLKPGNVSLLGSRSDVMELLQASDYFISASHHEGIPISVLEAASVGLPCLLSDIPGHKILNVGSPFDVVRFFKTGDFLDLQEKSKEFTARPQDTIQLGLNFKAHVQQHFSSESMYKNYSRVYQG